jgi:hypothetical protein
MKPRDSEVEGIAMVQHFERIIRLRKKDTFSAESIREGTVKGRRLGPPFIICFFTVHIIWSTAIYKLGVGVDRETPEEFD